MEFYNKINNLLKEKKITKKKLCEDLGISYNSIMSMFNRQSKSITMDVIESISSYLNVSVDYLIRDEITDPEYGKISKEKKAPLLEIKPSNNISEDSYTPGIFHLSKDDDTEIKKYPPEAIKEIETFFEYINHKYGIKG